MGEQGATVDWLEAQHQRAFTLLCVLLALTSPVLLFFRLGHLPWLAWGYVLLMPPGIAALWRGVRAGTLSRRRIALVLLWGFAFLVPAAHAFREPAANLLPTAGVFLVFAALLFRPAMFAAYAGVLWLLVLASRPLRVANGFEAPGTAVYYLDIGLEHLGLSLALWGLDRQFRRSHQALEHAVRRAEQASDAARVASESKLAFLANMSHELRTPLNAILGYAEMLAEEVEGQLADDVERMREAGASLLERIRTVLDTAAAAVPHARTPSFKKTGAPSTRVQVSWQRRTLVLGALAVAAVLVALAPADVDTAGYGALALVLGAYWYPEQAFRREPVPLMVIGVGLAGAFRVYQGQAAPSSVFIPWVVMVAMVVPLGIAVDQRGRAQRRLEHQLALARLDEQRARDFDTARNNFLREMSVGIRTPLATVVGYAEMLSDEVHDPGLSRDLSRITTAASHLHTIVGEVLDIATGSNEPSQIGLQAVPLSDCCEQVLTLCRPIVEKGGNVLEVLPEPGIEVLGDRQAIVQIMVNLVGNAGKFTSNGRVTVSTHRDGDLGRIIVADTGAGIPVDQLERIFEPFERLGASHAIDGTGLGLALSRRMAERMDGTLTADSAEGVGTRFTLTLRLA